MNARGVSDLQVLRYMVEEGVFIEWRGGDSWVVATNGRMVLNHGGEWEYEPNPSNRTDDFLARTRYKHAETALNHWKRWNP